MNKQLDPQYIDAVQELRGVELIETKAKKFFIAHSKNFAPQTELQDTADKAWEEYLKAQPVDIEKVKPKTD